ncbi:hypothetical protein H0H92_014681, partial [Tricholoma furcatifolium]
VPTLAKVVTTTSVPDFVPPRSNSKQRAQRHKFSLKKADVRLSHLSTHVQRVWESTFAPRLYEYFGTLYPWTKLGDSEVKTISGIWAEVFPTETRLQDDEELEFMVMKLVDDALGNWRHSFSSKAAEYLKNTIFSLTGVLNTKEARESWANWSLGSDFEGEQASYYRRFYYREYEEPAEPGGKITMKSPIVLETLAVHYALIKKLPAATTTEEDVKYPMGA